jgi:archaemetzincin
VQLRREVSSEYDIGLCIHGLVGVEDIVDNEPHAFGDLPFDDVRCGHIHASLGQGPGYVRVVSDADLDDGIDGRESVDERVGGVGHVVQFMRCGRICVPMHVDIVPVGEVSAQVKREASDGLRSVYDCEVSMHEPQSIPAGAYDGDRDQYRAEEFIDLARRVGSGGKNIAITPKDLFYRRRNYVFGLAYLGGSGSVISTYRLQTSSDGGFSNRSAGEIFSQRVRKEVVHEVGHTLGLEHCDNKRCVMNFSPTVRQVDVKEVSLCGSCQRNVL